MHPSDAAARLRQQGHRLTPQRLMVLEVVSRTCKHLTADEIYAEVHAAHPYVNIATIYRTLQWLQHAGLVTSIWSGSGPLRYEYSTSPAHHHLICTHCGREQEIGDDILDTLKENLLARYGFVAQLSHLGLTGQCEECRQVECQNAQP
jgi:Fur family ferric uptake transcriptional regulator